MDIHVAPDPQGMGEAAGNKAADLLIACLEEKGEANLIIATGASQFETLKVLTARKDIDWSKITVFHLDEYVGMDTSHPASFVKYLQERFVDQIDNLKCMHFVDGTAEPVAETERLDALIKQHPIDVALIGIGENAHVAFNDPPADFDTEKPYLVVQLDEACRKQQLGEGWFPDLESVPTTAISMSVRQVLKSTHLIVSVPDERKAAAVVGTVEGPITNTCPGSILREHANCGLYLDQAAASQLTSAV